MDGDRIERLQAAAGVEDAEEIRVLRNAAADNLKLYESEATAARKRNLDAARVALDEAVERLWPKYFPEDARFKNLLETVKYLKGQGYKIGKSKIYQDRKNKQIRVQEDGSVLKRDADAYAKTLQLLGDPLRGLEAIQKRKAELEAQRLEKIVKGLEYEQDIREKKYVLRADAELERANNASAIFTGISNGLLACARELIEAAGGDPARLSDFVAAMKAELERVADSLSKLEEFEMVFGGEVDRTLRRKA